MSEQDEVAPLFAQQSHHLVVQVLARLLRHAYLPQVAVVQPGLHVVEQIAVDHVQQVQGQGLVAGNQGCPVGGSPGCSGKIRGDHEGVQIDLGAGGHGASWGAMGAAVPGGVRCLDSGSDDAGMSCSCSEASHTSCVARSAASSNRLNTRSIPVMVNTVDCVSSRTVASSFAIAVPVGQRQQFIQ